MKRVVLFITFVIALFLFVGCGQTEKQETADYKIVDKNDMNYGNVVRVQFKILVSEPITEAKLRVISEEIIASQKKLKPHNALSLLYYFPKTDIAGHYTAGRASWAPNGKWEDAGEVKAGDYSQHRLVIETGNAFGEVPKTNETGIPEDKRRKIFYDLIVAQDEGDGDEKAYGIIAKKYEIDVDTIREIASEGVIAGWPMP